MSKAGKIFEENIILRRTLAVCETAMSDWLHTFADDHCDPARVSEAAERVYKNGTISYIATVQEQIRITKEIIGKEPRQNKQNKQNKHEETNSTAILDGKNI